MMGELGLDRMDTGEVELVDPQVAACVKTNQNVHWSKKFKPPACLCICLSINPYGTLRAGDFEGSDVEPTTLRADDFEGRRL